jgi:hypothetical protein
LSDVWVIIKVFEGMENLKIDSANSPKTKLKHLKWDWDILGDVWVLRRCFQVISEKFWEKKRLLVISL